MSQTIEKIRWTSRDLEGLPENEWVHYEIIDGELFMTRYSLKGTLRERPTDDTNKLVLKLPDS